MRVLAEAQLQQVTDSGLLPLPLQIPKGNIDGAFSRMISGCQMIQISSALFRIRGVEFVWIDAAKKCFHRFNRFLIAPDGRRFTSTDSSVVSDNFHDHDIRDGSFFRPSEFPRVQQFQLDSLESELHRAILRFPRSWSGPADSAKPRA